MKKVFTLMVGTFMALSCELSAAPLPFMASPDGTGGVFADMALDPTAIPTTYEKVMNLATPAPQTSAIFSKKLKKGVIQSPAQAPLRAEGISFKLVGETASYPGLSSNAFYYIPTNQDENFERIAMFGGSMNYGMVYDRDDKVIIGATASFSGTNFMSGWVSRYDLANCRQLPSTKITAENLGILALKVDKDPVTGRNYGYFYNDNGTGYVWGEADYETMTRRAIKDVDSQDACVVLGVNAEGQYYGVTNAGVLLKIDKNTGNTEVIAEDVDCVNGYKSASCINPITGNLLVFSLDDAGKSSYLLEVNVLSGAVSVRGVFNAGQLMGMFSLPLDAADNAPGTPELTLSAPEGTMTMSYSITLPEVTTSGAAAQGEISWKLTDKGEVIGQGAGQPGAVVNGEFTYTESGEKTLILAVSNEAGEGGRVKQKIYVGNGTPAAPENIKAVYNEADGNVTLSWNAVTTGTDGGYIAADKMTYEISNENGVLASGVTATSYTFHIDIPGGRVGFNWYVKAVCNGLSSEAASSDYLWFGAYEMPFTKDFRDGTLFDAPAFTVYDANSDGNTWTAEPSGAGYLASRMDDMDDWLFSPELQLEGGLTYQMICTAYSMMGTNYEQRIEISLGTTPTPEGMTTIILPLTEFENGYSDPAILEAYIKPDNDGVYYVGIHGTSLKRKSGFFVCELSISQGMNAGSPLAPENLILTPAADASLSVDITVTAPSLTVMNQPIEGDVTLTFARDGEEAGTMNAAPGATVTFTDTPAEAGYYDYTVTSSCGNNPGTSITDNVYVGPYAPLAPTNVTIVETDEPGVVTMTWDAPVLDIMNNPLLPSNLTYMVYGRKGASIVEKLPEPVSATTATFQALEHPEVQQCVDFGVSSFNRGLESETKTASPMIPLGAAYEMPVRYSNLIDFENYLLYNAVYNSAQWYYFSSEDTGLASADGDGYFEACMGDTPGDYADLFTGKIKIDNEGMPELSFYINKISSEYANTLEVMIIDGDQTTTVKTVNPEDMPKLGWNRIRVDLDQYKGKVIQVVFRAHIVNHRITAIDVMQVAQKAMKDLVIREFSAPSSVNEGEEFEVKLAVENVAAQTAENFEITLYQDGEPVKTMQVASLPSDETVSLTFNSVLTYFNDPETAYSAEVEFAGDETPENNVTSEIVVKRNLSKLKAVDDLTGESTEEGNVLMWTPYSAESLPKEEVTESFEDFAPWAKEIDGWAMFDVDGAVNGGFLGVSIIGYEPAGWFIWRGVDLFPHDPKAASATGEQCLVALYPRDGSQADDWAVSPKLTGEAQTLKFMAKCDVLIIGDAIEVLYTPLEDENVYEAYQSLMMIKKLTDTWTEYSVELPEGAMHFAIRSRASGQFLLMVDDVTYTPDPLNNLLTLVGYDVYRDGVKINDETVVEGKYLDKDAVVGTAHKYHVQSHYVEGDSELSNPLVLTRSSLDAIAMATGVKIAVEGRDIVVSGAEDNPVSIVTVDGKLMSHTVGDLRLTVAPAVYIVKAGMVAAKVIVK